MPYTDPSIYCPLCKSDLDAAQTWHYLLEEGTEEDDSRTGQPMHRHFMDMIRLTEEERSQEITVHDYCWQIVERIFRQVHFEQAWIEQFKSYSHLLSPFMEEAPFDEESHSLDQDVFMAFRSACRKDKVQRLLCIPLPPETIQRIYHFLDQEKDIIDLDRMISTQKRTSEPFSATCNNSQESPQTTNYRLIWANVEILYSVMGTPLLLETVPASVLALHGVKLDDHHNSIRYTIGLQGAHYFVFMFRESQDIQVLCGMAINGRLIGYEGPIWQSVQVTSFTGLEIASVENGLVGIHIKDTLIWHDEWLGFCPENSARVIIEWDPRSIEMMASHDDHKIVELGYRYSPEKTYST